MKFDLFVAKNWCHEFFGFIRHYFLHVTVLEHTVLDFGLGHRVNVAVIKKFFKFISAPFF